MTLSLQLPSSSLTTNDQLNYFIIISIMTYLLFYYWPLNIIKSSSITTYHFIITFINFITSPWPLITNMYSVITKICSLIMLIKYLIQYFPGVLRFIYLCCVFFYLSFPFNFFSIGFRSFLFVRCLLEYSQEKRYRGGGGRPFLPEFCHYDILSCIFFNIMKYNERIKLI